MKALCVAGALAVAMTFGTALAEAQTSPQVGDGNNSPPISTKTPGYNLGTGAAHVGDGTNTKPMSTTTPGYNVGTAQGIPAGMTAPPSYGTNWSARHSNTSTTQDSSK
jgi:hypothetical protein